MPSRGQDGAFAGVSEGCVAEIKERLERYHSPEQIAGRLKREGREVVSHETIYRMIYQEHKGLGEFQRYLRHRRDKRRRRGAAPSGRGRIPGRVGIEERPEIANAKT